MKKKKQISNHKDPREVFYLIVQIFLLVVMLVLIWKIGTYAVDMFKSADFSKKLEESVLIMEEESENDITETEPDTEKIDIPAAIDFDSLHAVSEDAVAWLFDPGVTINYAVAQAEDNDYYLYRLLNGSEAKGGTLFVDCRNSSDFSDWNTVIYGHNMKNGTMFASLLDYRSPGYYEEHPVMYLYTPGHRYRLELVAGYTTNVNDLIYSIPATKEERDEILEHAYKVSSFISDITVTDEDKLVTLSTCSYEYDDARYVVIGRLVEE